MQKHTIDILIIEILQIILWFHPLFYFIKKSIKLNHEFLADSSVLKEGIECVGYQQILLSFSSSSIPNQLSNAINYALLKKRFKLMKTQTSQRIVWIKSFTLLPLFAILIYSFSSIVFVQKKENSTQNSTNSHNLFSNRITIKINKKKQILLNGRKIKSINDLFGELREITNIYDTKQLEKIKTLIEVHETVPTGVITDIKLEIRKTGLNLVEIVSNGLVKREYLNQQKATQEQLIVYNKLAKKYNMQPKDQRIIKRNELKRLEYIYGLMTENQKKDAEPFPECPPPPLVPITPKKSDSKIPKPLPQEKILPIPPKPPITPLDHIIAMAKKGAVFYYDGKEISSDKAIKILKKNRQINISTKKINSNKPIVNLSTEPIEY